MTKQALIFGATGAVGRQLLEHCLNDSHYDQVTVIARRATTVSHTKLNWIECGFDKLDKLPPLSNLNKGDTFCCLGTTIKAAGSPEAFRQVDYDYVVEAALFAKRCEVKSFNLITAIGADAASKNYYSQTKGDVETAIIAEGFATLRIFRPSLLKGERDEFRIKEEIGNWISLLLAPLFFLGLRKYQPIAIDKLARAIYTVSTEVSTTDKVRIYESDELQSY